MRASRKEYQRMYYLENRLKINEKARANRLVNPEETLAKDRAKYQRNKTKIVQCTRDRRLNDPRITLFEGALFRSRVKNLPFDLKIEDIEIPEICPLLEIPLKRGIGSLRRESPSLDRIDPDKGYVVGNVWVVSHRANMLKNSSSLAELEMIVKNLKERKNKDAE